MPTVKLATITAGSVAWDYLTVTDVHDVLTPARVVPTRPSTRYCFYSQWHLIFVNALSRERTYGVYVYDACRGDRQLFPTPVDIRQGSCNNDDSSHNTARYSLCPIISPGHVPTGLAPGPECNAESVASTALLTSVDPLTYDATKPATLTLSTALAGDFLQRLREGTCTDVLDWQDVGWTLRWPDGSRQDLPGTGQTCLSVAHTVIPTPGAPAVAAAGVDVVAHLHITGDALDFDADGNLVTVHRDAYVDISNRAGTDGVGAGITYTLPWVIVAAHAALQLGDGSVPVMAPSAGTHADGIRGRLLLLFPDVIVSRPGSELLGGAAIGSASTVVTRWTYTGGTTDAPLQQATAPGASGPPALAVGVQWNHAERLSAAGQPIDEVVPLTVQVRSTYPDGHIEMQTVAGSIAVSLYYPALSDAG